MREHSEYMINICCWSWDATLWIEVWVTSLLCYNSSLSIYIYIYIYLADTHTHTNEYMWNKISTWGNIGNIWELWWLARKVWNCAPKWSGNITLKYQHVLLKYQITQ